MTVWIHWPHKWFTLSFLPKCPKDSFSSASSKPKIIFTSTYYSSILYSFFLNSGKKNSLYHSGSSQKDGGNWSVPKLTFPTAPHLKFIPHLLWYEFLGQFLMSSLTSSFHFTLLQKHLSKTQNWFCYALSLGLVPACIFNHISCWVKIATLAPATQSCSLFSTCTQPHTP